MIHMSPQIVAPMGALTDGEFQEIKVLQPFTGVVDETWRFGAWVYEEKHLHMLGTV